MANAPSFRDKAASAWPPPLPDWVAVLALACDAFGLRRCAAKIGVSPATLSLALAHKGGKSAFLERRVNAKLPPRDPDRAAAAPCPVPGTFSLVAGEKRRCTPPDAGNGGTGLCPVLGAITRTQCLRVQSLPFSGANPLRVSLFRACRNGCPYYYPDRSALARGFPKGPAPSAG